MKRMRIVRFLVATVAVVAVCALPNVSHAIAVYVEGDTCPSPQGSFTRQYQVVDALRCVYDPAVENLQGTTTEANTYLNGQTGWGTGWVGLGTSDGAGGDPDINGFSFTTDADNDNGTFTIDTGILNYGQFAIGIKDGGSPSWAIFLLPEGVTSGDWNFLSEQGDLSHFALFARNAAVSEPTTLALLGTGLFGLVFMTRRWRRD